MDDIPQPKSDAKEIVGLVKSSERINGYQLSAGSTVSKAEGVALAKDGEIKGVGIAHKKDTEYLKRRNPLYRFYGLRHLHIKGFRTDKAYLLFYHNDT